MGFSTVSGGGGGGGGGFPTANFLLTAEGAILPVTDPCTKIFFE